MKLKYGSLIKTIEASNKASASAVKSSRSGAGEDESNKDEKNFCKNCLRLFFAIIYLIYSKCWVIINTSVVFLVIFICYTIK